MRILFILFSFLSQVFVFAQPSSELNSSMKSGSDNNSLEIPPILEYKSIEGVKTFELRAKERTHDFSSKFKSVHTMSYNDMTYLGPTIRVRQNDEVEIKVYNNLDASTTLHQHGLHLPSMADGSIFHPISPSETWSSVYTVTQAAGSYWYHPHKNEETGYQVIMGLAGFLIIDDDIQDALDLPHSYGIDDIPLIIQDKSFGRNSIVYDEGLYKIFNGNLGDYVVTNGALNPSFHSSSALIRLRILNASSFGTHIYSFEDKRDFYLIANDGSLLERPIKLNSFELTPSERSEILVDISDLKPNTQITLMTRVNSGLVAEALTIIADKFKNTETTIPRKLVTLPRIEDFAKDIDAVKEFTLYSYDNTGSMNDKLDSGDIKVNSNSYLSLSINGVRIDPNVANVEVDLNNKEKWIIRNPTFNNNLPDIAHSFHPHNGNFMVASVNGKRPRPEQMGWKDTIKLNPGEVIEIIMEFKDYTGKYLYHCHKLEHEDYGMMGVFEVVDVKN